MADWFAAIPVLFAQAAAKGAKAGGQGDEWSPMMWWPLPIIFCFFYFVVLRPQQQQEKKRKEMLSALKKNDRVMTTAGIHGTVVSVDSDQDKVVLRVDDDKGIKLTFSRASIVRVVDASPDKDKAKTAESV